MSTLDEMEARARRQLDGMRVNTNVLAQDVLTLAKTVRRLREQAAQAQPTAKPGKFSPVFDDIFKELFK